MLTLLLAATCRELTCCRHSTLRSALVSGPARPPELKLLRRTPLLFALRSLVWLISALSHLVGTDNGGIADYGSLQTSRRRVSLLPSSLPLSPFSARAFIKTAQREALDAFAAS